MSSPARDRFLASLAGGQAHIDDLDLAAFFAATEDEQNELRQLVLDQLARDDDDARLVNAVVAVCPAPVAMAALSSALPHKTGRLKVVIAERLLATAEVEALAALRQVLYDGAAPTEARVAAVVALGQLAAGEVNLRDVTSDGNAEVRKKAAELLAGRMHLGEYGVDFNAGGSLLMRRLAVTEPFASVRDDAIAEIRRVYDAGGPDPAGYRRDAAGSAPTLAQFLASLRSATFDLTALDALVGDDRQAAIMALVWMVTEEHDARALAAFKHLGDLRLVSEATSALA